MESVMIIDFKARIMPGMDNACKSRLDTIRRLIAAKNAGVDVLVAAPLYDPDECSVDDFLDRRHAAEGILNTLTSSELPEVVSAAMVKYSDCLLHTQGLERLCFGGDNLLLSMLDVQWSDSVEAVLRRLTGKLGLNVTLADAAALLPAQGEKMQQLGLHVMLDLEDLHHKKQIQAALPFIESGLVIAIGSNSDSELPYRHLGKTMRRMSVAFDAVMNAGSKLLERR